MQEGRSSVAWVQRAGGPGAVWRWLCGYLGTYLGGTRSLTGPLAPSAASQVLHQVSVWRGNENSPLESTLYLNTDRARMPMSKPSSFLPGRGNGFILWRSASLDNTPCYSST